MHKLSFLTCIEVLPILLMMTSFFLIRQNFFPFAKHCALFFPLFLLLQHKEKLFLLDSNSASYIVNVLLQMHVIFSFSNFCYESCYYLLV